MEGWVRRALSGKGGDGASMAERRAQQRSDVAQQARAQRAAQDRRRKARGG